MINESFFKKNIRLQLNIFARARALGFSQKLLFFGRELIKRQDR
jgi:hypothetical protein